MPKKTIFHYTLNDGPEKTIVVKTGVYKCAAAAVPALAGVDQNAYPLFIKIWVPSLLPDYGPYEYHIGQVGGAVGQVIRQPGDNMLVTG